VRPDSDKQIFLDALKLTGNVRDASSHCSINPSLHFRWKKRDPEYLKACDVIEKYFLDAKNQQYLDQCSAFPGNKKVCKRCGIETPDSFEFFDKADLEKTRSICRRCDTQRHREKIELERDGLSVRRSTDQLKTQRLMVRADRLALKIGRKVFRSDILRIGKGLDNYESRERYANDPDFRRKRIEESRKRYQDNPDRERLRVTYYKHANPDKAAKWGEKRKQLAAEQSDGSLTHDKVGELFGSSKRCPYCERELTPQNKTLDHMIALCLGGSHGIHNVLICCRTCNMRKNAKPFVEWISTLSESCERRARRIYRQRYGVEPEQAIIKLKYA
jgi:hypothetical protein